LRMKNKRLIRFDDKLELPEMDLVKKRLRSINNTDDAPRSNPVSLIKVITDMVSDRAKRRVMQANLSRFMQPIAHIKIRNKRKRLMSCSPKREKLTLDRFSKKKNSHKVNIIKANQLEISSTIKSKMNDIVQKRLQTFRMDKAALNNMMKTARSMISN